VIEVQLRLRLQAICRGAKYARGMRCFWLVRNKLHEAARFTCTLRAQGCCCCCCCFGGGGGGGFDDSCHLTPQARCRAKSKKGMQESGCNRLKTSSVE
jgi:hypothetical protein